jgi:predicted HAD superfamily Cof-like phosphohydrolase
MSKDWVKDLNEMHAHYGFHEKTEVMDPAKLAAMLQFRKEFIQEEVTELATAIHCRDAEGVVDSLIDICVVAIGTLDLYGIDSHRAWEAVRAANMSKETGVKHGRPNPLGLPDLIKPPGWVGPDHRGNHGTMTELWGDAPRPRNVPVEVITK